MFPGLHAGNQFWGDEFVGEQFLEDSIAKEFGKNAIRDLRCELEGAVGIEQTVGDQCVNMRMKIEVFVFRSDRSESGRSHVPRCRSRGISRKHRSLRGEGGRVCGRRRRDKVGATHFGVECCLGRVPRVAQSRNPWLEGVTPLLIGHRFLTLRDYGLLIPIEVRELKLPTNRDYWKQLLDASRIIGSRLLL